MDQPNQQKRLLLTIVASTAVMILWMVFFAPKPPPAAPDAGTVVAEAPAGTADAGAPAALAPAPAQPPEGAAAEAQPAAPQIPEQQIDLSTPAQGLVFTNRGAGLERAVIKDADHWASYKFEARVAGGHETAPSNVDMVAHKAGLPPAGASELVGGLAMPFDTVFETEKTSDGVIFRATKGAASVEKQYWMNPNGYDLRVQYRITNKGDQPQPVKLGVVYPGWVDPATQKKGSFFSPPPESSDAICRRDKTTERVSIGSEATKKSFDGPVQFVGFDQRYFMGVIFPRFDDTTKCEVSAQPDGSFSARLEMDLGVLAPGQTITRDLGMYIGPKSISTMQHASEANVMGAPLTPIGKEIQAAPNAKGGVDPQLNEAVDFGWWAVIARLLLAIMKAFQKVVVNWGLAIVLLTLLVKLLLYPLSHKQMESMESMKRLQPQMDALAKKYEKDKEKLNMERMRLFQENKVNPFGGCLPLLIQMPVWIALYRTLLGAFELYREPLFPFWIHDLTLADPYYILPLAMGVTMFITQKMQPQMGDPTQAKIMLYFMPIFFTFIMLSLPAGLTLYIFTNNLLSIAQQKYLQRKFAKRRATA